MRELLHIFPERRDRRGQRLSHGEGRSRVSRVHGPNSLTRVPPTFFERDGARSPRIPPPTRIIVFARSLEYCTAPPGASLGGTLLLLLRWLPPGYGSLHPREMDPSSGISHTVTMAEQSRVGPSLSTPHCRNRSSTPHSTVFGQTPEVEPPHCTRPCVRPPRKGTPSSLPLR